MDHFASGEAPYIYKGTKGKINTGNPKKLIAEMNARYEEKLADIRAKLDQDTPKSSVEPAQGWMQDWVAENGHTVTEGVQEVSAGLLLGNVIANGTEDQSRIGTALQKFMDKLEWAHGVRVLVGDAEALNQWRDEHYPGQGLIDLGMTDFSNKTIYIANQSGETVLHEMLHAVLGATLHMNEDSGTQTSEGVQRAIRNEHMFMTGYP